MREARWSSAPRPRPATVSGAISEYIIGAGATGAVTVPTGYNYILDQATGPITVTGNGATAETFIATNAASTAPGGGFALYNLGSGTVVAGSGADTIVNVEFDREPGRGRGRHLHLLYRQRQHQWRRNGLHVRDHRPR